MEEPVLRNNNLSKELLICDVCSGQFRTPRMLPCQHTFCTECLYRYYELRQAESNIRIGAIPCPTCRTVVALPLDGVDGFPQDIKVGKIKDLVERVVAHSILQSRTKTEDSNESFDMSTRPALNPGREFDIKKIRRELAERHRWSGSNDVGSSPSSGSGIDIQKLKKDIASKRDWTSKVHPAPPKVFLNTSDLADKDNKKDEDEKGPELRGERIYDNAPRSSHNVHRESPIPQSVHRGSPIPHSVHRGSPIPQSVHRDSPTPRGVHRGSPIPHNLSRDSPVSHSMHRGSPIPQSVHRGSPVPHSVPRTSPIPHRVFQNSTGLSNRDIKAETSEKPPEGRVNQTNTSKVPTEPPNVPLKRSDLTSKDTIMEVDETGSSLSGARMYESVPNGNTRSYKNTPPLISDDSTDESICADDFGLMDTVLHISETEGETEGETEDELTVDQPVDDVGSGLRDIKTGLDHRSTGHTTDQYRCKGDRFIFTDKMYNKENDSEPNNKRIYEEKENNVDTPWRSSKVEKENELRSPLRNKTPDKDNVCKYTIHPTEDIDENIVNIKFEKVHESNSKVDDVNVCSGGSGEDTESFRTAEENDREAECDSINDDQIYSESQNDIGAENDKQKYNAEKDDIGSDTGENGVLFDNGDADVTDGNEAESVETDADADTSGVIYKAKPLWHTETKDYNMPTCLAFLPDNGLVVAEYGNSRLQFYDHDGKLSRQVEGIKPFSVIVDLDDYIVVGDRKDKTIKMFDLEGQPTTQWEKNKFQWIGGVAVNSKKQYVIYDRHTCRVGTFDMDGMLLTQFGSWTGSLVKNEEQDDRFSMADFVAVDSHDRIVICDSGNHCMKVFSPEGEFLYKFGARGKGPAGLEWPKGVCVDRHDNFLVTDMGNRRVSMFSPDGQFIQHIVSKVSQPYNIVYKNPDLIGLSHYALNGHAKISVYKLTDLQPDHAVNDNEDQVDPQLDPQDQVDTPDQLDPQDQLDDQPDQSDQLDQ